MYGVCMCVMHLQCTKTDTHIGMKLVGRVGWVCNKHFNAVERDFFYGCGTILLLYPNISLAFPVLSIITEMEGESEGRIAFVAC